jgi:Flp pilus assembly protein TadG
VTRSRSRRSRVLARRLVSSERGSAAVEFALIAPLLLLIVFGVIDFGIAFTNYENVRSGTRDAARMGVVNDLQNAPPCTIDGTTVTPPADPVTTADATDALVCDTKSRIGLSEAATKVRIAITGEAIGDDLVGCASFPVTALTGLTVPFLGGQVLTSTVTMRLEQAPTYSSYTEPGVGC